MMTIKQVIQYLEEEIEYNKPIVDGEEQTTDGTDLIIIGRSEMAEGLLKAIKVWK